MTHYRNGNMTMSLLNRILKTKRMEIIRRKIIHPVRRFNIDFSASNKDFIGAIRKPGLSIIAEIKRQSPSAGLMREIFDPLAIAKAYELNQADGLSILTDQHFFGGSCSQLAQIKDAIRIPVLRKDFIIDEYQIYESKAVGADAILLIVRLLGSKTLKQFLALAEKLDLDCLVEVHSLEEIRVALDAGITLIGINNRDLDTLRVDINLSSKLKKYIPDDVLAISESGIRNVDHIQSICDIGFDGVLIGESFMQSDDPDRLLQSFKSHSRIR